MRVSIIDTNYRDQKYRGLAASWLEWECKNNGVEVDKTYLFENVDFVLMTVSSQQGLRAVKTHCNKIKKKTKK